MSYVELAEGCVTVDIYITAAEHEKIKERAEYAALEGLIEGHPRGNLTAYCNFCFNVGEEYLRQHVMKKRGFK